MSKLEIIYRPVADLRVNPANARKHSQKQVEKIAASIQSFGFNVPLLTNGEDQLVAGHGRFAAARHIGLTEVPTIAIAGRVTSLFVAPRRAGARASTAPGRDHRG